MSNGQEQWRVALVVASMRVGGAERMTLNLAGEFARRGLDVDLVLVDRTGPLLDEIPPGVRLVDLGASRARGAVLALRRYFRLERPRAVLSVAFQCNLLTLAAAMGLGSRPRIVVSVRNAYGATLAANPLPTRILLRLFTGVLYRRADWVVGISDGAAEDLRRLAGLSRDRVRTIYNPVLRDDFDRLASEPADRLDMGPPDVARIITVGRLVVQKDQATLLRAFARLVAVRPARLVLLGEGVLRAELVALANGLGIADHVMLPGVVPNPFPYMREADLFVLSSAWEGFGNVLVEAMATGTPVISTDCPHGPREILEGGKWGRLVPPGDDESLAEAMLETLQEGGVDPRRRARVFTVEAAADRYLDLLSG